MRRFANTLVLGVFLIPLPASADGSGWFGLGQALDAARAKPLVQIKNDKQQKAKNKACGPGKLFVENEGCVKRDKAEKVKAKEKEEKGKEKAEQTQPAPQQADGDKSTGWMYLNLDKKP